MPRVAVASVSATSAAAGARIADEGGNAVDAAVATALVSVVTHPAMCSLGGGGYLTIWPAGGPPVTVDGGFEMPGRGLPEEAFGGGRVDVHIEYGGGDGVETVVGPGSVATPGLMAACALAAERYGRLPWKALVEPAWEHAREGFPMPASSHEYLTHAHEEIYGQDPRSRAVLHDADGRLLEPGEEIRVPHLARTLRAVADEGVELFYRGDLGRRIARHVQEGGGILGEKDLRAYRAEVRAPLESELDGWRVATNPPPALGGVTLTALLAAAGDRPRGRWTPGEIRHLVRVLYAVQAYRRRFLDASDDPDGETERLLEAASRGGPERLRELAAAPGPPRGGSSGATLHTSAVDSEGTACAVTLSDGYGSGVMPPGTGLWLNNCLGEKELNRRGFHAVTPGRRLPSNMAPTVARRADGSLLAVGSPGAERIPTAVFQVLLNFVRTGTSLAGAVEHPRLHVEHGRTGARVACEPGLPLGEVDLPVRLFDRRSMFFGGVEAAVWTPAGGFSTAADSRRTGGTAGGGRAGNGRDGNGGTS